mmetsp:Transcript_34261/g.79988  ORF Transcript_34261/g.79988 Transcript_34261/m.79988 type:complete len:247 (-) Transcript_34261:272-1012(-)
MLIDSRREKRPILLPLPLPLPRHPRRQLILAQKGVLCAKLAVAPPHQSDAQRPLPLLKLVHSLPLPAKHLPLPRHQQKVFSLVLHSLPYPQRSPHMPLSVNLLAPSVDDNVTSSAIHEAVVQVGSVNGPESLPLWGFRRGDRDNPLGGGLPVDTHTSHLVDPLCLLCLLARPLLLLLLLLLILLSLLLLELLAHRHRIDHVISALVPHSPEHCDDRVHPPCPPRVRPPVLVAPPARCRRGRRPPPV